jgi:hypothetical protein
MGGDCGLESEFDRHIISIDPGVRRPEYRSGVPSGYVGKRLMREYMISRSTYQVASTELLRKEGFETGSVRPGKVLAKKSGRSLYIDIAGKYLPYFGSRGEERFPWETHLRRDRLSRIERAAKELGAEPWLCFCYFIRDSKYELNFDNRTRLRTNVFGVRLISVHDYRSHMRSRSPRSWDVVELPRKEVLKLTIGASDV